MMSLGNCGRVSFEIAGQRMDNLFSDLGIDPFSHYRCSFSGMRLFAAELSGRASSFNNFLGDKLLKDDGGIVAAESECV